MRPLITKRKVKPHKNKTILRLKSYDVEKKVLTEKNKIVRLMKAHPFLEQNMCNECKTMTLYADMTS